VRYERHHAAQNPVTPARPEHSECRDRAGGQRDFAGAYCDNNRWGMEATSRSAMRLAHAIHEAQACFRLFRAGPRRKMNNED
jgi:transposase